MAKKKDGRGGARPGAGRPKKANAKVQITASVTPAVAAYLRQTENISITIDEVVRRTADFKRWEREG
ncbi:MAG: hypothetical protein AAFX06_23935 [Planctomycetota bacterium]